MGGGSGGGEGPHGFLKEKMLTWPFKDEQSCSRQSRVVCVPVRVRVRLNHCPGLCNDPSHFMQKVTKGFAFFHPAHLGFYKT